MIVIFSIKQKIGGNQSGNRRTDKIPGYSLRGNEKIILQTKGLRIKKNCLFK